MNDPSAEETAARLTPRQRLIAIATPENWSEADAVPDGLFDHDETYNSETSEESGFWPPTDLGKRVHDIVDAEDR